MEMETENQTEEAEKNIHYRPAYCVKCTNEWIARNGDESKPTRCPACNSRRVKWRDLCTEEEIEAGRIRAAAEKKAVSPEEKPPTQPEKTTEEQPDEQPEPKKPPMETGKNHPDTAMEKPEQPLTLPKIPMQAMVLILGLIGFIGLIFFLKLSRKQSPPQNVAAPQPSQIDQDVLTLRRRLAGGY